MNQDDQDRAKNPDSRSPSIPQRTYRPAHTQLIRFGRSRRAFLNRVRRKVGQPIGWSRLMITAALVVQFAFALAGPFSEDFATAWSPPTANSDERAIATR